MKLINFRTQRRYIKLWQDMGIPRNYGVEFNFRTKINQMVWENPEIIDKPIRLDEIKDIITDEGFITSDGRRVIVYINNQPIQYFKSEGGSTYKFHLTWCRTLDSMSRNGRYKKYVVSSKTDGFFHINYVDGEKIVRQEVEKLYVCKNCLKALNWHGYEHKGYKDKEKIYDDFDLEEFFSAYKNDNEANFASVPEENDITAPPNIYDKDWKVLSQIYRERHNWTCEECHRQMKMDERHLLHVHHRDGVKSNCKPSNLVVLCADCHQKKHPDHKIFGSNWGEK